jgi:opacity protein-like surface antigen
MNRSARTAFIVIAMLACCAAWAQDDDARRYLGASLGTGLAEDCQEDGGFAGGTQTGLTFGAGVRFHLGETFGVRAEWQHYEASGGGDDLLSLGVFFRF